MVPASNIMQTGGRWSAVFISLIFVGAVAPALAQDFANEYRVKAAFLYQFPQFVEWPSAVWRDADTVRLCVAGNPALADELGRIVEGEDLNDRKFEVVTVTGSTVAASCHLLFVRGGRESSALLKAVAGRPILTVADSVEALELGAVIGFRIVDRRVRFEVNTANARRNGLRISSQLLGLALAVRGATP